jgi:hypothetical protein
MNRTALVCSVLVALGLAGIGAELWHLRSKQKQTRARLAREQAEEAEADAVLQNALSALRRRDAVAGRRLLKEYLHYARASQKERARVLLAEVQRATAPDRLAAFLRGLDDDQIDELESGPLPSEAPVSDELARAIFLDRLRAGLPRERRRRADLLAAEQAEIERRARQRKEREVFVLASAPYKGMVELAAGLRKRYLAERALLERQRRALERVLGELNIGGEEEAALRKELAEAKKRAGAVEQAFAARRGQARKALAAVEGATPAHLEVFDRLLDRLAEGLRADPGA